MIVRVWECVQSLNSVHSRLIVMVLSYEVQFFLLVVVLMVIVA